MKLVVDGREAYAYTGGKPFDPALPCVVFVHGASNDHSVWTLLARWFAHHGHAVLAVDLPGHSRSEGPLLTSVEAMADWVLAMLDAAGVRRAALVGHSMGSLIALEAAARAPDRIPRLVMIGTAYPMTVSDALLATAREAPERAMAMVNAWSIASLATKPGFPSPGNWLHGSALALARRVQRAAPPGTNLFLEDFEVCHRYAGGLDAAARVACPVTMILGRADQMTPPRATKEIAAALKARVVQVPSGHHQLAETPDATLAALRDALA
ncbi:MAG: alpha/beta hydrolase [Rubrivivax sp.]|jgi:pimeloyl-ACP methyl ester carboxylesterase|nr:alpha/beta hydrolase [Rubrivivax sp.]